MADGLHSSQKLAEGGRACEVDTPHVQDYIHETNRKSGKVYPHESNEARTPDAAAVQDAQNAPKARANSRHKVRHRNRAC
jgi:hypothetical protein